MGRSSLGDLCRRRRGRAALLAVLLSLALRARASGRRSPTVPPLQPATRTSVVIAPAAVALTAIRDAMEAQAPRDLSGKRENPVGQLLQNAELGWTITRGPLALTGRAEGLTVVAPLNGAFRLTGQIGAQVGNQIGNITGALGGLLNESLGKQSGQPHRPRARSARRRARQCHDDRAALDPAELAAGAQPVTGQATSATPTFRSSACGSICRAR